MAYLKMCIRDRGKGTLEAATLHVARTREGIIDDWQGHSNIEEDNMLAALAVLGYMHEWKLSLIHIYTDHPPFAFISCLGSKNSLPRRQQSKNLLFVLSFVGFFVKMCIRDSLLPCRTVKAKRARPSRRRLSAFTMAV